MKHLYVFLFFFLSSTLFASSIATFEVKTNKTSAYVKEAVEITIKTRQVDHSHVMFFFVEPKKSDDYKAVFLGKEVDDKTYHDAKALFHFVLFPLKPKEKMEVAFDFTVKTATDNAVAKAYTQDHDESGGIDLHPIHIPTKPLVLQVKPLAKPVSLVGDFILTSTIDKKAINQYQSVNLRYLLRGSGYMEGVTLFKTIKGTTVFADTAVLENRITPKGYIVQKEYIYAISAKRSFYIPSVKIEAFSPKRNLYYTLTAPPYNIKVEPIDPTKLIDKEERPHNEPIVRFETLKNIFIYVIVFIFGYFTAKVRNSKFTLKQKNDQYKVIQNTKTPKELLIVLLNKYRNLPRLDDYVTRLEKMIQNNDTVGFEKLKKEIVKRCQDATNIS